MEKSEHKIIVDKDTKEILEVQDSLERLMDFTSLSFVIRMLETICEGKVEHVRNTWDDEVTAKTLEDTVAKLDSIASKFEEWRI